MSERYIGMPPGALLDKVERRRLHDPYTLGGAEGASRSSDGRNPARLVPQHAVFDGVVVERRIRVN